jgi:RNA polymerase sigma factor (sigma-70 family)
MPDANDMELLRDYARQNSEAAFAELVRRHIALVYSAALRHVGIAAQAEEITQAVFIILARKASGLRPDTVLEGWLYETTRLTSLSFMRGERRRQFREQEAYMQSILQESTDDLLWNQLAPLLDEAMSRLGRKDRDAVVLRFFKEKSVREVAATLQVNEAAAQRRILRALEKLRKFFTKHGVSSTTAILAGVISANSIQAVPVALAKSVTAVAIAKGAAASGSTLTLVKGALKIMAWTKAQTAIVSVVVVGMAAYSVIQHQAQVKLREQNESLQQQVDQLSQLTAQNQNLSNLLAQANSSKVDAPDKLNNLLQRRESNKVQAAISLPDQPVSTPTNTSIKLPKDSWSNAGFATPEATLKTRGWAVLNGDRQQFAQSVSLTDGARKMIEDQLVQMASTSKDPDAPRLIQQALAEKWGAEEAILMPMMAENQNNTYTDYKILSQQSPSADEMIMEVETDMASAPPKTETVNFQRFGNDWKIVIDEATVRHEMEH